MKKTISFIGAGKMAEAIIKGILRSKLLSPGDLIASDPSPSRSNLLKKQFKIKIVKNNPDAVKAGEVIVLAVKPQNMKSVLVEIAPKVGNKLVISIAAGIKVKTFEEALSKARIIRVMPNNPCIIGKGISAICKGSSASKKDLEFVKRLFRSVGEVIEIKEALMDAATAVSGSGPGFIYFIIEAFIEAAKKIGFSEVQAKELVIKNFFGSIRTIEETNKDPKELRAMVTSPGGTTEAGIRILEEAKFKEMLSKAITSAKMRAEELSKDFS